MPGNNAAADRSLGQSRNGRRQNRHVAEALVFSTVKAAFGSEEGPGGRRVRSKGSQAAVMRAEDRKVLLDVGAWAGNVCTSVLIIFINKILMSGKGYNFQYGASHSRFNRLERATSIQPQLPAATTLCALHYLTCSVGTYTLQKLGKIRPNSMPLKGVATDIVGGAVKLRSQLFLTPQPLADLALFTVTADLSIVTLNLSLLLNPVAFYQVCGSKLATTCKADQVLNVSVSHCR